jgi:FG-GAP repeat
MRTPRVLTVAAALLLVGSATAVGPVAARTVSATHAATASIRPAIVSPTCPAVTSDFDGDGHSDLAATDSVPWVHVLPGSTSGLSGAPDDKAFGPGTAGMPATEDTTGFARQIASGDFNGDCRADLAIVTEVADGDGYGALTVLFGSDAGLTTAGAQLFHAEDLEPHPSATDFRFGDALASGDFDHDGYADVAIGIPAYGVEAPFGGAVAILYGSPTGLTHDHAGTWFTQDTPGVQGVAENDDQFGTSLAAADFDGDGFADLAIGSPGETVGRVPWAGLVTMLKGSSTGLTAAHSQVWTQHTKGVPGASERYDQFGQSLAAGDITGDGRAELAIGSPYEDIHRIDSAGMVTILRGASGGLTTTGVQTFHQGTPGIPGIDEADDQFGSSLALGDLDGDGHADLAIGAVGEAVGHVTNAGTVTVLMGSTHGLRAATARLWTQATATPGMSMDGAAFGFHLRILPITSLTHDDLIVSAIGTEGVDHYEDNGAIHLIKGGPGGLHASGSQIFQPTDLTGPGRIPSDDDPGDELGSALD